MSREKQNNTPTNTPTNTPAQNQFTNSEMKQIKEMACDMCTVILNCNEPCEPIPSCHAYQHAKRAFEKGYRKQSEWISVDERLPEEDGEYLTWNGIIYYLIEFNASLGLWNVSTNDTSTAIRDVTHWMPLPEAPKMKGGAE